MLKGKQIKNDKYIKDYDCILLRIGEYDDDYVEAIVFEDQEEAEKHIDNNRLLGSTYVLFEAKYIKDIAFKKIFTTKRFENLRSDFEN